MEYTVDQLGLMPQAALHLEIMIMNMIFALAAAIPVLILLVGYFAVRRLLPDLSEIDEPRSVARPSRSLFARLSRWVSQPVPKLDYRRDKAGRFRKVRRG